MYKTSADLEWQRINAREDIGKEFEYLFPSMLQRLFQTTQVIDMLKQELNHEPSCKEVEIHWERHIDQSNMSEKVTSTYIETVMLIRRKILSEKKVLKMLLDIDDEMVNSPWKSAYTLALVANKFHGGVDRTVWIIAAINKEARDGMHHVPM